MQANPQKTAEIWMNGQYFKCAGDVCLRNPSPVSCQTEKGDGMIDSCTLHGEIWTVDDAFDTWDE